MLAAMTPVMAQDTIYAGQTSNLGVVQVPGDTYIWELYNDVAGSNLAITPGNCPASEAYFTSGNTGSTVNVMWVVQGTFYYKVTATRPGCNNNVKVGMMVVLWEPPTATIGTLSPICAGDSVHMTVTLTGTAPWSFTLTDGMNSWVYSNISASPFNLTVPAIPLSTTSYWISEVTDAHVTNTIPSLVVVQVVNPLPVNSKIYQYGP